MRRPSSLFSFPFGFGFGRNASAFRYAHLPDRDASEKGYKRSPFYCFNFVSNYRSPRDCHMVNVFVSFILDPRPSRAHTTRSAQSRHLRAFGFQRAEEREMKTELRSEEKIIITCEHRGAGALLNRSQQPNLLSRIRILVSGSSPHLPRAHSREQSAERNANCR